MKIVATLRVRRSESNAVFLAERLERVDGVWDAGGRWRYRSGRLSGTRAYSWPVAQVLEVRWARGWSA